MATAYTLWLAAAGVVPSVKLNNGVSMPVLAFAANVWDAATCASATSAALSAGFTFIWSSQLVGNDCQLAQAKVLKQITRTSLFVAGTADTQSCMGEINCYAQTKAAAAQQLGIFGSLDVPNKQLEPRLITQFLPDHLL